MRSALISMPTEMLTRIEIIQSAIVIVSMVILYRITAWSVYRFAKKLPRLENRKKLTNKYIGYIFTIITVILLIVIWSVNYENFWVAVGSAFTVIGVALFANWSILSNITAGFILFFTFPFKIGDRIRIHDKDLPVTATIEDIVGFYAVLKTDEGEVITYPNNLFLQKGVSILNDQAESIFDVPHIQEQEKSMKQIELLRNIEVALWQ